MNLPSHPLEAFYVSHAGFFDPVYAWDPTRPTAVLPGSFNPAHVGHWRLAEVAADLLGLPVAFELSVANVDKPDLPPDEVRRRLTQFAGRAPLWLTKAPRFSQKAQLFPGAVFVVGADTAQRLVEPRYYDNEEGRLHRALDALGALGCRFLVACRADAAGRCLHLDDIPVPADYRGLFTGIPAQKFRLDVSSSALRTADRQPAP